jgi:CO/xanthine dehydrogenase Mo-binding subunit
VIVPTLGGGFGAKGSLRLEPLASLLAAKARRPVKITLERAEEFVTVTKHAASIRLKTGVAADGRLLAREITAYFDTGAYADVGPIVARNAGLAMGGPYRLPHVKIDSYSVWTNAVPAGAFRGFGVSQGTWAYESQMDLIAERLGIDPLELRRMNLLRDGDRFATGEELSDLHYDELLDRSAASINWSRDDARWLRPIGASSAAEGSGSKRRGKAVTAVIKSTVTPSTSTAQARLNEDGSLHVLTSSVEMGQGVRTVLAQLAAEAADLPVEQVFVSEPDTDLTPYDQQTSSSRSTYSMGSAVVLAVRDVRRQLLELAAEQLEVAVEDLRPRQGRLEVSGAPGRSVGYDEVVRRARRGNLLGQGHLVTEGGLDPATGQGIGSAHWHHATAACEVEVDIATGKVEVLKLNTSVFAGRAVNPRLCELQSEGSAFFGLGQALFEEMLYDDGQVVNRNLADYMIPSFEDVPREVGSALVEHAGAGEIHGIGETTLPPIMPAIANAVYNAVGVRIVDLPLTPEKVLRGLSTQAPRSANGDARREGRGLLPVS